MRKVITVLFALSLSACVSGRGSKGPPITVNGPGYRFTLPGGFKTAGDGRWTQGGCSFERIFLSPKPDTSEAGCAVIAKAYGEQAKSPVVGLTQLTANDGRSGCLFSVKEEHAVAFAVFPLAPAGLALRAEGKHPRKLLDAILRSVAFSPVSALGAEGFTVPVPARFGPARGATPPKGGVILLRDEPVAADARLGSVAVVPVEDWLTPPEAEACAAGAAVLANNRKLNLLKAEVRELGGRPSCVIELASKKHAERRARQYNLQVGDKKLTVSCNYDARDTLTAEGCDAVVSGLKPRTPKKPAKSKR